MDYGRELVEKLCNLEIPSEIKISPHGEKVLYSTSLTWGHVKGEHSVTTLWLATFGEEGSSKKITDGTHNDRCLAWHPHDDGFAFVSDRAGNATKSAIYTTSLKDIEKAEPITPAENEQAIEQFKFSADGKTIAYISKDEKTEEEKQRESKKEDVQVWGQGHRYSRLRIINLETKEVKTLQIDQHVLDFCWISGKPQDPEKQEIAFSSCKSSLFEHPFRFGTKFHVVDANLKQPREVCSFPNRPNNLCWGSTNDGSSEELYFWSSARVNKNFSGFGLYKLDIRGDACEYEQVSFEDEQDIFDIQSVNGNIIAKAQRGLEDCLIHVGVDKLYSCKQEMQAHDVAIRSKDKQLRLVVATSDVNHTAEVYSVDSHSNAKVQLSRHGEIFEGQEFGKCTIVSCPTTDHHKIEIDGIYLEPTTKDDSRSQSVSNKPYPTVVLIHGGPSARITNAFNTLYYMWTPYLLSLGYGILLPNYRGGSGRGEEFSSSSYGGVGVHAYADVIALTQHAVKTGFADPERLVVGGYSHGGLLTSLCALRNGSHDYGWTFKAAISGASINDIDNMSLTSDLGSAYQAELHNGALPWTMDLNDTSTRTTSALWAFKEAMERSKRESISVVPPILIIHGASDERCHISQAWGLQRALEYYSLPFEMAIYPRQGHIFHEQYFWIDMALRIGRWVERYIGPGQGNSNITLPTHDN